MPPKAIPAVAGSSSNPGPPPDPRSVEEDPAEEQTSPKRKAKKDTPAAKRRKTTSDSAATASQATGIPRVLLDNIDPQLRNTVVVRDWLNKQLPKVKDKGAPPLFTPYEEPVHLRDMPDMPGRDFFVPPGGCAQMTTHTLASNPYWVITVQNRAKPSQKFQVFAHPLDYGMSAAAGRGLPSNMGGPLLVRICSTSQVAQVGDAACRGLNKWPGDIEIFAQYQDGGYLRTCIQLFALLAMGPTFDYRTINPEYLDNSKAYWSLQLNTEHKVFRQRSSSPYISVYAKVHTLTLDNIHKQVLRPAQYPDQRVRFTVEEMDVDRILQDRYKLDSGSASLFRCPIHDETNLVVDQRTKDAMSILFNYVRRELFMLCGTQHSVAEKITELVMRYLTRTKSKRFWGPVNGKQAWTITDLSGGQGFTRIRPSQRDLDSLLEGSLPEFRIASTSKVQVALVIFKMCEVLSSQLGLVNCWQQGKVSSAAVTLRRFSRGQAIDYCLKMSSICGFFVCMSCFTIAQIGAGSMTELDDGRLICRKCAEAKAAGGSLIEDKPTSLKAQLRLLGHSMYYYDREVVMKALGDVSMLSRLTEELRQNLLQQALVDEAQGTYQDEYSPAGTVRKVSEGAWSGKWGNIPMAETMTFMVPSPFSLSGEAINPFAIYQLLNYLHTSMTLRHTPSNTGITVYYLNTVKNRWPPCVVPLLREAAVLRLSQSVTAAERSSRMQIVELGFSNIYMITTQYAYRNSFRVARRPLSPQLRKELEIEWKSGIWNGYTARNKRLFGTSEHLRKWQRMAKKSARWAKLLKEKKRKEFKMWTQQRIAELKRLFREIEQQYNYTLPKCKNDCPWIFMLEHMPSDKDYDWPQLFAEFLRRYYTLDEECDIGEDTPETPDTICIIVIILICKNKGKDTLLGLPLTLFNGHPLRLSIGRADHADPKDPMTSGCQNPAPKKLSEIDVEACNMAAESWLVNLLKFRFPKEIMPHVVNDLATGVAPATRWYNAIPSRYRQVPFPVSVTLYDKRTWPPSREYMLRPLTGGQVGNQEDEDEDDDEEVDTEDEDEDDKVEGESDIEEE